MSKDNINPWLTYSLLGVFLIVLIGIGFVFYQYKYIDSKEENLTKENLDIVDTKEVVQKTVEEEFFPKTELMTIASTSVQASVAATWPERIKGLSDSPYLPKGIVKFFVFDTNGIHSIWMIDMKYSIDIIWVDENNKIVDIKEKATPESYPEIFSPKEPALYVIETEAGFVYDNKIEIGQNVTLPKF